MTERAGAFDWIDLEGGRARFAGGIRGVDEVGHDTFAVEVDGLPCYGEISKIWRDDAHFELEVSNFGHYQRGDVGMPMNPDSPFIRTFSESELQRISVLIVALVATALQWPERPVAIDCDSPDEFLGRVLFRDGWALQDAGVGARP